MTEDEIMAQVLKDSRAAEKSEDSEIEIDSDDETEIPVPVITATDGIPYLCDLARLFDMQAGQEFHEASRLIPKLLRSLNTSVQEGKKQSKVMDYFIEWPRSL